MENDKINRLVDLMRFEGLNQESLAQKIGYDKTTISKILSGNLPISKKFDSMICFKLGLNAEWWETGEGEITNKFKRYAEALGDKTHENTPGYEPSPHLIEELQRQLTQKDDLISLITASWGEEKKKNQELEGRLKRLEDILETQKPVQAELVDQLIKTKGQNEDLYNGEKLAEEPKEQPHAGNQSKKKDITISPDKDLR